VGQFAQAWMTIGLAGRLQGLKSSKRLLSDSSYDDELRSRCYWSIYILEKVFGQPTVASSLALDAFPCPSSPAWPPRESSANLQGPQIVSSGITEGLDQGGIMRLSLNLTTIWGEVSAALGELRSGKRERPWLPESVTARLITQMYECEARMSPRHLLKNVNFRGRSTDDFLQNQDYWICWAYIQIAFHALRAVINHPFFHLISTHDHSETPMSSVFLQQAVDAAVFNATWVARLLRMFETFPFQIHNPVIGYMVAATASVLWFFQFAREPTISKKAKADFDKCRRFLERRTVRWPHMSHKVRRMLVY
jgi:hypothetical protein